MTTYYESVIGVSMRVEKGSEQISRTFKGTGEYMPQRKAVQQAFDNLLTQLARLAAEVDDRPRCQICKEKMDKKDAAKGPAGTRVPAHQECYDSELAGPLEEKT